jgi:hypothetical protein
VRVKVVEGFLTERLAQVSVGDFELNPVFEKGSQGGDVGQGAEWPQGPR